MNIRVRNSYNGVPIIEARDDEGHLTFSLTEDGDGPVNVWVDPVGGLVQIDLPEGSIDMMAKAYRRHVKALRKAGRVGY